MNEQVKPAQTTTTLQTMPQRSTNLDDLATPGVIVELSPEEAEAEGLTADDTVDFETAMEANADVEGTDDE